VFYILLVFFIFIVFCICMYLVTVCACHIELKGYTYFRFPTQFCCFLLKAKFHYDSWFEAGWKLVADRFEAGRRFEPVYDQLPTSFEPASVMEFGFKCQRVCRLVSSLLKLSGIALLSSVSAGHSRPSLLLIMYT